MRIDWVGHMNESLVQGRCRSGGKGWFEVRDIRDDLIERLEKANADMAMAKTNHDIERRELEQRFNQQFIAISERQKALGTLLDDENSLLGNRREVQHEVKPFQLPLPDFILNILSAAGSMSKDEIKDAAERAGYESAGRMVHATLMNIVKSDRVLLLADGQYHVRTHDLTKPSNLGIGFRGVRFGPVNRRFQLNLPVSEDEYDKADEAPSDRSDEAS